MKHFFLIIFLLNCFVLNAQLPNRELQSIENLIDEILFRLAEEGEEGFEYSMHYDELLALAQSPINLNRTTQERMKDLFFLSDIQIENILFYIYQFGTMQTIYELRLIDGLTETDIKRMLPFVYVGEKQRTTKKIYWREVLKFGKSNLFVRFDRNLETARGFIPDENGVTRYAGSPIYHSLRYQFQYRNRILFGITAEKDAGEQFLADRKGYDFFSAYIQLNEIGRFKTITLGDFRANFGEGLVMRQNFRMGKSAQALNISRTRAGLRKSTSTDEYNFLRGIGATMSFGNFDVTAFYSNKKISADTTGGTFPTIVKNGLHRTATEIARRKTVNQQVIGGNVSLIRNNYQIEFTVVHTSFSLPLEPNPNVYNAHFFSGKSQTSGGFHYRLRWHKLNFFGETAMTDNLAFATTNGVSFMPISRAGFVVLHRYFAPEYNALFANAFGETSRTSNEKGIYLGTEIYPVRRWKISAYADATSFPWLRYGVSSPSNTTDYMLNADFTVHRNLWMLWRVNYKKREMNFTASTNPTAELIPHKRLAFRYGLNSVYGNFRFQTLVLGNVVRRSDFDWTYGVSALQDVSYVFKKIPLRIDFRYQFFDVENFDNRIYTYERDVLHAFSIPMNYGIGSRYYLNVKYDLRKNISIWFKISQTTFADDRETTGTGNDQIEGNRRTNARLLMRWKF